jgi:hypothetical protein
MEYYRWLKLGLLLLFCFAVGGTMVAEPLRQKGLGGVHFADVYPGLGAILAGFLVIGLVWFLGRVPQERAQEPPDRASGPEQ